MNREDAGILKWRVPLEDEAVVPPPASEPAEGAAKESAPPRRKKKAAQASKKIAAASADAADGAPPDEAAAGPRSRSESSVFTRSRSESLDDAASASSEQNEGFTEIVETFHELISSVEKLYAMCELRSNAVYSREAERLLTHWNKDFGELGRRIQMQSEFEARMLLGKVPPRARSGTSSCAPSTHPFVVDCLFHPPHSPPSPVLLAQAPE